MWNKSDHDPPPFGFSRDVRSPTCGQSQTLINRESDYSTGGLITYTLAVSPLSAAYTGEAKRARERAREKERESTRERENANACERERQTEREKERGNCWGSGSHRTLSSQHPCRANSAHMRRSGSKSGPGF